MPDLAQLFEQNRAWAAQMEKNEPGFFAALAQQQVRNIFGSAAPTAACLLTRSSD
jgi:hypothetical protein